MKLVFPLLPEPLCFEENRVNVLIVEDPFTLRNMVKDLCEQAEGLAGDFVLSLRDTPQEMAKLTAVLVDPLHPETASKKLAGKILKTVSDAAQDHENDMNTILSGINSLASKISLEMRFPAVFDPLEGPSELFKLLNFRLDSEGLDLPELLLEWMLLQREYLGKRLFVLIGLKSYLSREELKAFYQAVFYEKLDLLLIEPFQRESPMEEECVTIIDEDLCVIR